MPVQHLAADRQHDDHPCTRLSLLDSDRALLGYMLQDLRALVRRMASGQVGLPSHETLHWDVHGLARRMVICDPTGLGEPVTRRVVGFFGERRPDAEQRDVDRIEVDLLPELRLHPGILGYSSMELVDDHWANLVVHTDPADTEEWRSSAVHQRAVDEVSPRHYRSVRIHNGRLPGGVTGTRWIEIERTKFWDYRRDPVWRAERVYGEAASQPR